MPLDASGMTTRKSPSWGTRLLSDTPSVRTHAPFSMYPVPQSTWLVHETSGCPSYFPLVKPQIHVISLAVKAVCAFLSASKTAARRAGVLRGCRLSPINHPHHRRKVGGRQSLRLRHFRTLWVSRRLMMNSSCFFFFPPSLLVFTSSHLLGFFSSFLLFSSFLSS